MPTALKYLWTAWCAVAITCVILVLFPILWLMVNSGIPALKRKAHRGPSIGARVVLFLWGMPVVEVNREIIDHRRQCIYLANHRSDLDIIVTAAVMRGFFKFFGKSQIYKWPFFGFLLRNFYVSVDRANESSRRKSLPALESAAATGASVMIYPEGWSNFSGKNVLPLHKGAFELALRTGLPLAVLTIVGTHKRWPKPTLKLRPGKIYVYWEKVIETAGDVHSRKELMDLVSQCWDERLTALYPQGIPPTPDALDFETWKAGMLHPGNRYKDQ